jgi:hypothetical protein
MYRTTSYNCCGKNVGPARTIFKHRLEEKKIYYTSGPAPWISPKNGTDPLVQDCGFFYASECRSKQAGRTKADVAEVTT